LAIFLRLIGLLLVLPAVESLVGAYLRALLAACRLRSRWVRLRFLSSAFLPPPLVEFWAPLVLDAADLVSVGLLLLLLLLLLVLDLPAEVPWLVVSALVLGGERSWEELLAPDVDEGGVFDGSGLPAGEGHFLSIGLGDLDLGEAGLDALLPLGLAWSGDAGRDVDGLGQDLAPPVGLTTINGVGICRAK
jgi:hypothetical protein